MRKTIAALLMLGVSWSACAGETNDAAAFQENMQQVMVDILCHTGVIKDMASVAAAYMPRIKDTPDAAGRTRFKHEFGNKLHEAWLNQRYDMSRNGQIVKFLKWMNTQPMNDQSDLSKTWALAAHRQCPAVANDYLETNSAALTLVSTVVY